MEEHREAARRKKVLEDDDDETTDEDESDKRARLRQTEQDSDLKHAEDLFANVGLNGRKAPSTAVVIADSANPGQAIDLSQLALFKPGTKSQFEALSAALVPLITASANKPHYSIWASQFVKQICNDLPSTEIKKAASGLTALSNEKMKEEKAQDKGSKKSKAAKTKTTLAAGRDIGRGAVDTTSYADADLGEDDFM